MSKFSISSELLARADGYVSRGGAEGSFGAVGDHPCTFRPTPTAVTYTLTVNDHAGTTQTMTIGANGSTNVTCPVDSDGYYVVIITANTSDGFTRHYAGRVD